MLVTCHACATYCIPGTPLFAYEQSFRAAYISTRECCCLLLWEKSYQYIMYSTRNVKAERGPCTMYTQQTCHASLSISEL